MTTGTRLHVHDTSAAAHVPDGVKLHMFECGTLKCHLENIKMNQGLGEEYEIPVPWFLIEHPGGLVVIDGGNAAECAEDPEGRWGGICDVYWPEMTREQACVPAMKTAGFDPSDVRYVLQSHLHLDHTGALGAVEQFPNAEVIATRDEYDYAHAPDWFAAGGYIQKDFNKAGVPWALLENTEDGYDVFGDGTIRCWRTRWTIGRSGRCPDSWPRRWTPFARCASCIASPGVAAPRW